MLIVPNANLLEKAKLLVGEMRVFAPGTILKKTNKNRCLVRCFPDKFVL